MKRIFLLLFLAGFVLCLSSQTKYTFYQNSKYAQAFADIGAEKAVLRSQIIGYMGDDEQYADSIDSMYFHRSEKALYDRTINREKSVDIAWGMQSSAIESLLARFDDRIKKIVFHGGTINDRKRWEKRYQACTQAIDVIKGSHLPVSKRLEQYIAIKNDIQKFYDELQAEIVYYRCNKNIKEYYDVKGLGKITKPSAFVTIGIWKSKVREKMSSIYKNSQ